jgi:hypothetical protein
MNLDEVIQLQLLKLKATSSGRGGLASRVVDQAVEAGQVETKQMCAKVTPQLFEAMKQTCSMLDMSQREFIEAAVSEAIRKAEEMATRMGVFEQGDL